MADLTPDFTFDPEKPPERELLAPLYRHILTAGPPPTVALGQDRTKAEAWLRLAQERYKEGMGKRSHLILNMDLVARVNLVGLAE